MSETSQVQLNGVKKLFEEKVVDVAYVRCIY